MANALKATYGCSLLGILKWPYFSQMSSKIPRFLACVSRKAIYAPLPWRGVGCEALKTTTT